MSGPSRAPSLARYSTVAIVLHWIIAAAIVLQVALAGRMEARTPEAFAVAQLHKSVGITILILSLARLAWRLTHRPPPEPEALAPWERRLAAAVHWGFYAVMILMPLSGWIMVSTSRLSVPTLLYGVLPWPHLPGLAELAPAARAMWNEGAEAAHESIVKVAYGLFGLHVAGALKHHFADRRTPILTRMAPGVRAGRWWEPRLLAVGIGLVAVAAFGRLYDPPRRVQAAPPSPPAVAAPARETPSAIAPPIAVAPAPSAAVRWTVQPGSTLGFATAWSGEPIQGRFDRWTADIVFSPDDLDNSRVTVRIDMASARTGDDQRDASLPAPDWFDAANHPKATFTARRFEERGDGRYVARGQLSLRGATRPLSLPFRLTIDGDRASVRGVTSLDRTAFGVGQGEWTSTDQIPAKVTVRVDLKARRASP